MIQDLKLAGLVEGTSRQYVRVVRQLTAYSMVSPDRLTERQVEQYLLYVRDELGAARETFDPMVAGLKFLYLYKLGYNWLLFTKKVRKPRQKRLPEVRTDADCRRLIAAIRKPVYRGCFTLIYAYGLRISEAITLPVSGVDSKQMVLRVIGKGNKQRVLPLTEPILQMLREIWKILHSQPDATGG